MNSNQRNVLVLFFTMIVVMLGFGIIIPIMPFYIKHFDAGGSALGALMATYGIMQFIFAPVWGSISDRIGRRPILMIGVLGNAIAQLLMGLSTELWMLFAARALAGVLSSATLPTAMAYIGDSSSAKERSGRMGIIGAAMGIGMVIGPGLGGWLGGKSLSMPFFLASGLSFLALILVFIFLPEPPRNEHAPVEKIRGLDLSQLWRAITGPLGILFVMAFLLSFGLTNFESVFGLYAAAKYNYNSNQVGMVLVMIGVISAVTQGMMTGPVTRRFGEVTVVRVAMLCTAVGFVLLIFPQQNLGIYLACGYFVLSNSMINPAVASLISKNTSSGQGVSMGINNSFLSLGRIIGPLWAGVLFDFGINLPYLSGATIMFIGFVVSIIWLGRFRHAPAASETPLSAPSNAMN